MAREDRQADGTAPVRRRQYLKYATVGTAATGGLAGCIGGNGNGGDESDGEGTDGEDEAEGERPEGVSEEEFEQGPVPDEYATATSLGAEERNPDELSPKSDVEFSEYEEATENEVHDPGTCCANCADYIPDKNGDAFGACAEVEGYVDGEDWCTIYEGLPEPEVPGGMSEEELSTAPVPEEYRTAESQAGEERDPDDLRSQEDVDLMESVEAIAEGTAPPGQSCGNCADYIPDKNGDKWGACAAVEGYVAAEDWCIVYESISEDL
jgi:hypothetical protein